MHEREHLKDHSHGPFDSYWQQLAEAHCPVVMQRKWADIPRSEAYPFSLVDVDVFGGVAPDQRYGSSIAYMLAYAIACYPSAVGLWGVDLKDNYDHQRPNIALLVGMALGRGIRVDMPPSVLRFTPLATKRYGFTDEAA